MKTKFLLLYTTIITSGAILCNTPANAGNPADKYGNPADKYGYQTEADTTYTLKSCLEFGLENNFAIQISRNDEETEKNKATRANAGLLPTVDASAGYSGSMDILNLTKSRNGSTTSTESGLLSQGLNAGVDVNWTVFDGFRLKTNYERLQEMARIGETRTRIAIEDFIASLTSEYFNFIQQKIRLKNLRYAVTLSKERLRIVEERYIIGNFSRLDLQQARVDFNADSADFIKQQEQLYTSHLRLNELMCSQNMNKRIDVADSVIAVDKVLDFEELWASTLKTNASLIEAEQNRMVADLDMKTVLARNYPYVRLNAGYGYNFSHMDRTSPNIYSNRMNLNLGVTVGFTIFDGNRAMERANAKIAIENAKLQKENLTLSLRTDLETLWHAYTNNLELLALEKENLVAAKENHDIAMERYLLGNLSGIEMREAQKSLLDAEERILTAQYNTKICEISLLQLSGMISRYLE